MVIGPLHRKVLRDLRRLWAQVLAISLVLAAGVATMILGNGAYSSLYETRARYYEDARYADVFTNLTRAPRALISQIENIEGVLSAEGRIVKLGLLDMPDMTEPGSVLLVSLPQNEATGLNRLHLREGRLPDPQSSREAVVSEGFASAHRLRPGSEFVVLMNGQRRELFVTGIALSPEFIYSIGPGQMMPDPRHYGIVWMPLTGLAATYDLEGAFSNVVLKLAPGASQNDVIEALDRMTAPYGGVGASGREDQISHAFLDAELRQLSAMVKVLPPIFLLVAALLVNMTLSRLITLEREQIGLLKAVGYASGAIAWHYVEFVLLISVIGIAIGFGAGAWLGVELAQMYARFFTFPYLVFTRDPQIYAIAALVTGASAVAGTLNAVRAAVALPPAIAMAPPVPVSYRKNIGFAGVLSSLRQTEVMMVRHLLRWPFRTLSSVFGVAMAVALLVASLWSFGSIDFMIDVTFFRTERQNATVVFASATPLRAVHALHQMPGVMVAEPFRSVAARISHRNQSKRLSITGKPTEPKLSRTLDPDLRPMPMPEAGIVLSEALSEALGVRRGDSVTIEVLEGNRPTFSVPVSGISVGYIGLGASMELSALNRVMNEGPLISGVNVEIDPAQQDAFFKVAKAAPKTGFITVTSLTIKRFQETLAENITAMITVYVTLAGIIAVGIVYNFARISLSEQGREFASLRVLGFTHSEVAGVLLSELAAIVLMAQPLGWVIGYAIGYGMVTAFSSDLYRVPFVVGREVYAIASLVICAAATASAFAIWGRINNLDLIEVLKTRE